MNDTYVEVLVKRKDSLVGKFLRTFTLILAAMFAIFGIILSPVIFIGAIIFGAIHYVARLRTEVEFEYLYVDKEITIDRIYGKTKRKRAEKIELERVEIIAPMNSYQLDSYKNRNIKPIDYSSQIVEQPEKRYVIYYNGVKKIIFEPNPAMLKAMQMVAPRKVFTN
jgi:hypothetical protein